MKNETTQSRLGPVRQFLVLLTVMGPDLLRFFSPWPSSFYLRLPPPSSTSFFSISNASSYLYKWSYMLFNWLVGHSVHSSRKHWIQEKLSRQNWSTNLKTVPNTSSILNSFINSFTNNGIKKKYCSFIQMKHRWSSWPFSSQSLVMINDLMFELSLVFSVRYLKKSEYLDFLSFFRFL